MEKQVTGPSAVQVAVLKTSLQKDKQCVCQLWKAATVCQTAFIHLSKDLYAAQITKELYCRLYAALLVLYRRY